MRTLHQAHNTPKSPNNKMLMMKPTNKQTEPVSMGKPLLHRVNKYCNTPTATMTTGNNMLMR